MEEEQKLLMKAALIKLMNNEPMSLNDLQRVIDLLETAQFPIQSAEQDEIAAVQSRLIGVLQEKFMKGQPQM
jgi:hypothetical protein